MPGKTKVIAQAHYWDPEKKKTIWKRVYTLPKKYNGDVELLKADLEKWRDDNLKRVKAPEAVMIRKNNPEEAVVINTQEDISELDESVNNQSVQNVVQNVVHTPPVTKFKLNIEPLKETGCSTVIFGSSKSGKTTQLKQILKKHYDNNNCITILIADSVHANVYRDLSKKIIKTDKFDRELIQGLHKIQKKTDNKYHFVIVLDDMILDKNDPELLRLILTLRNSKISTVCLLQSPTLLSKNARFNGNNFIFRRTNNAENTEQILDMFLGGFPPFYGLSKAEQVKLYRDLTTDYGYIYLDALNDTVTVHR